VELHSSSVEPPYLASWLYLSSPNGHLPYSPSTYKQTSIPTSIHAPNLSSLVLGEILMRLDEIEESELVKKLLSWEHFSSPSYRFVMYGQPYIRRGRRARDIRRAEERVDRAAGDRADQGDHADQRDHADQEKALVIGG
jgi:hypothetical protein